MLAGWFWLSRDQAAACPCPLCSMRDALLRIQLLKYNAFYLRNWCYFIRILTFL